MLGLEAGRIADYHRVDLLRQMHGSRVAGTEVNNRNGAALDRQAHDFGIHINGLCCGQTAPQHERDYKKQMRSHRFLLGVPTALRNVWLSTRARMLDT